MDDLNIGGLIVLLESMYDQLNNSTIETINGEEKIVFDQGDDEWRNDWIDSAEQALRLLKKIKEEIYAKTM